MLRRARGSRTNRARASRGSGIPRPHPFRFCGSSIMGAAASRDPPRARGGVRDAGRERAARDRAAVPRRLPPSADDPGGGRDLLGDAWPAAETRALALALAALPDALDPANPALASAFDLPPGAVAESAFTPARDDYETGDDDPSIDSAATPNSQTPRRAPPRGAFPWTVAARAAALRESRDAREAAARSALALAFEREEASRSGDEDATTMKTEALRRGAAPPRRRRGRRRSETYERLERSKVSNVRPNAGTSSSELSDEDLFVLRPLDAIAAACVGECASDAAADRDELARRCVAFLAARCPAAIDAFGVARFFRRFRRTTALRRVRRPVEASGRSRSSSTSAARRRSRTRSKTNAGGIGGRRGDASSERVGRTKHTYHRALITRVSAWALAGSMPPGWRVRWRRVFHPTSTARRSPRF